MVPAFTYHGVVVDSFFAVWYDKIFQFIWSTAHSRPGIHCYSKGALVLTVGKPSMGPGVLIAIGLIIVSRSQINFNNTF